jgi:hypothetical protein
MTPKKIKLKSSTISETEPNTTMKTKSQLGQFYTTNYDYILQDMVIPSTVNNIIEPFAGNGDLIKFAEKQPIVEKYTFELYDIDPKCNNIMKRDTLKNPPDYDNKFVLTNPPYLARNKNKNKELYDMYNCNDLYKCFIINLINSHNCQGGIIIIPLNFLSSIRKSDINLRKDFVSKYSINKINIFEEQVFDDTAYAVCSIQFSQLLIDNKIDVSVYPSNKNMELVFTEQNNYTIGGEIYNLPNNPDYEITRATKLTKNKEYITNILLKCIDDNADSQLGFKIVNDTDKYIDDTEKLSARSYATLVINKTLTLEKQQELVDKMNVYISEQRNKYNSLFLTNYRESNTIARKRISFDLAFKICNYIISSS